MAASDLLLFYLLIVNLLAFALWGMDKGLAAAVQGTGGRRDRGGHSSIRRIPEKTLLAAALVGGVWGCWAGVFIFHHKIRKPKIIWFLVGIAVIHLVIQGYLLSKYTSLV
jgi:uncharacterized membrane protein YsdA (DUF1294 family)